MAKHANTSGCSQLTLAKEIFISNVSTHYAAVIISDKRGVTKTWLKYRNMTGNWVIIGKQVGNWEYSNSGGTTQRIWKVEFSRSLSEAIDTLWGLSQRFFHLSSWA